MPPDVVALRVSGRELSGWTGVSIGMAIDQVADTFSLTLPYDPARSEARKVFRPFGYERVEVRLDDELMITGTVEKIEPKSDAGERGLSIEGRSLPGPLCDCGILGDLEFSGLALSTIARQVCKPFGLQVRADNDTNPIDIARAEYGQAAADFLNSLAAPRNLFLNSANDGKLVISWAKMLAQKPAAAALVEGEPPLLSVAVSYDGSRRFSKYVRAAQFAGAEDIRGQAVDSGVKAYRPQIAAAADTDSDPNATARRARTAGLVGAVSVTATTTGWRRPDGQRWSERQALTLKAPGAMVDREAKFIIAGVTLRLDASGGKTAELRLVLPELYSGEMPKVVPWA